MGYATDMIGNVANGVQGISGATPQGPVQFGGPGMFGPGSTANGQPISGISTGQGMVGQYDANGNLIPGTGGAGNPNGPSQGTPGAGGKGSMPVVFPGGNTSGQLPQVPIDANGNPTGPATGTPGAGGKGGMPTTPGMGTPGTTTPGAGGKGSMPGPTNGGTNISDTSIPTPQPGAPLTGNFQPGWLQHGPTPSPTSGPLQHGPAPTPGPTSRPVPGPVAAPPSNYGRNAVVNPRARVTAQPVMSMKRGAGRGGLLG
jgi:hypothetical protein